MSTLQEAVEAVLWTHHVPNHTQVAEAVVQAVQSKSKGSGWLLTGGEVYKIIETDWQDGNDESCTYTVYTEAEPEVTDEEDEE